MSKIRVVVLTLIFTGALTFAGYRFHNRQVAASANAGAGAKPGAREDLRQFMQSRVHQEYTLLSFTIWHDRPLTPEKMDVIAASSSRVMELTRELSGYAGQYKQQGWSVDDLRFFEEKRLQLSRVAEELNRAAKKHDSPEVINFFMHMDSTCQSCHRRFRPDLQWI
jgi:cytochrome c556